MRTTGSRQVPRAGLLEALQALKGLGVSRREIYWRVWREGMLPVFYSVGLSAAGKVESTDGKKSRREVRYCWILDDLDASMC